MKDGKCAKCGSSDLIPDLTVYAQAEQGGPIFVQLEEPEPEKRPFIWKQNVENANFKARICGSCGYTEFYSTKAAPMLAAHKKGYK